MAADRLRAKILRIAREAGAEAVAVAYHDWETRTEWSLYGDVWFHAASTIKLPVMVGVYGVVAEGELGTDSRVHVRNRFRSVADGEPFRVEASRDANSDVQAAIGRTMKVEDLARHMIVTSSNLATNLLLDLVGVEEVQAKLASLSLHGVRLERGVEDERAFERGINNRVTAKGLLEVLRVLQERRAFSAELSEQMLEILHGQEFNAGIPAGLPDGARVAHKTGEISTIAHDAGLVYLEGREPYAVVILTEWPAEVTGARHETIARISRAIFEHLCGEGEDA
ncbi:MAG TPA: serine hydrolase [Longimicrobiales bacterium]|nr:serine hydrolase [Longimicrobiales bacterium]